VTTVLVIDIANAINTESKKEKPNACAIKKTIIKVPRDSGIPTMIDVLLTDLSLAIGNSVPMTNKSIMMPSSANTFTVSTLCISVNGGV
jgi:hypothetical protein